MEFPEPVISVAVEPKTKADQEKMGLALQRLAKEDPSFRVHTDQESGQTIISGMGELHLEIIVDRMKREFKVEANVGKPQVAYRETIRAKVEQEGKFVRQSGGRGQYGHVWLKIEPLEAGQGLRIRQRHRRRRRAARVHSGRGQGHQGSARAAACIAGYPVVDVKVTLFDGSYHDVDSNEMAFKIAGSMASRKACASAKPVLLEPIMKVEVVTPEDYSRRHHRRPEPSPRPDPAWKIPSSGKVVTRRSAAGRDVRLRDVRALDEPGPRDVHHGICASTLEVPSNVAERA